jgi:hypothetical protein
MTDSTGARYGQGGTSSRLSSSKRGDPRARRAAQASRTDHQLGSGLKRDEKGRDAVDVDAVVEELRRRGLVQ